MANKSIIPILTAFLALLLISTQATTNPGVRLRITDKGLQYVDSIAVQLLDEKIKTASIPDITGDADTPVGHVSYSLSSIHFNSFSIPSSAFKTDPGVGLQLQISGASTSLSGNWHYREDHWPHISGGGSFDLDVSSLTLSISMKLGADSTGHPTIAAASCSSSIGDVNIHFHGGASWLYNLFDSYIDKKIKETLQDKLCEETSDLINNNAEKELSTFPVKKQINKYAVINYSLVSNPNFTDSYADVFIKGEFQSPTAPKEAPFSPASLPPESESVKMVYVWVTDYLLNTAGLVFQDAGVLNETVTPSRLPPNFSYPLNTNTFKLIIPKLYQMYPNRPMKLVAYSTQRPKVSTTSAGVDLSITGQVESYVQLENGSFVYTFTMGLNISALAKVAVRENNITGHVDTVKVGVSLIKSAIGDITIDMKLLQFVLDAFADKIIVKQLNEIGDIGFPLPVVNGIQVINAQVMPGQNFNLIATDVKYSPTTNAALEKTPQGNNKIVIV
ncbi:hypothetical protein OS493_022809 [Desmophyllum pertusum]|uniref:Bactericidal permeability-increasing protein n=1 Tax=Desmophyllum pertusum TaxID=174260 RepID=A0A9X0A0S8_9CNID|nr:hypothetical protein OS493_022809 [Desmophyllum pertusum]